MSTQITPAGRYVARPVNWKYEEVGEKGTPCVKVQLAFNVKEGEADHKLTWNGFLTEKTKGRTIESLIMMGFTDKNLNRFVQGTEGGALDVTKTVSIVVEHKTNDKGKTFAEVRWVNPVNGGGFVNAPMASDVLARVAALGLEADILQAKKEMGVSDGATQQAPKGSDDIPF